MTEIFMASLALGLTAGLSAGMFGIGGGVLIVPVLSWIFARQAFDAQLLMLMAIATSLATAFFTSAMSAFSHHRQGNIDWRIVRRLALGMLLGAVSGAMVAKWLDARFLRWFFIAYLSYASLKMARPARDIPSRIDASLTVDFVMSNLIGVIASLLGIGGGTMTVPYMLRRGFTMKQAVAISSACAMPIAWAGACSYVWLGWQLSNLPPGSLGYVYLPAFTGIVVCSMISAPWGAKLAHVLPAKQLKRYFSVVMILIALKMAWS